MTVTIDTRDLRRASNAFRTLQQPQLKTTTSKALTKASGTIVVPEMRRQVTTSVTGKSPSPRPSWMGAPKRGTAGPLAKSVRAKQYPARRRREGEMIAIGVGPRAWYKHFVIQGTQAHTLRGPHGTYRMDGHGKAQVPPTGLTPWHPGANDNDIVGRTERSIGPALATMMLTEVVGNFQKAMARKP